MTKNYESLSQATDDLKKRGFTLDFRQEGNRLICNQHADVALNPEDFEIVEFYRFEGKSNPGDTSIAYAVEGKADLRGILVDAYGAYAGEYSPEMLKKLDIRGRV